MAANQDDIRQIQVGLSFLGGVDSAGMVAFTEALKTSHKFFSNFDAKGFVDAITQGVTMAERARTELEQIRTRGETMQGLGKSTPIGNISPPNPTSYLDEVANYPKTYTGADAGAAMILGEMRAQRAAQQTDSLQQSGQTAQETLAANSDSGNAPPSLTPPPDAPSTLVKWINAQSLKLRRLGQGHLGMGSLYGGGAAGMSPKPEDMPTSLGASLGGFAKNAAVGTVEAGLVGTAFTGAYKMMQNIEQSVARPFTMGADLFNPFNATMTGAQLGYQRGGSLGLFQNPFNPAQGEGYRQAEDIFKLAFQPGINLGQAQQIEQASAQYGFSGAFGGQVTDNLLAPLFQQFGMNPQQILQNFGAGLRTGVITVKQLKGELEGLGQAAQTASMSLTDTSNAVAAANQAVQSIGGTPQTGIQFGTQFQGISGLPATVGASLVTNPFIQSYIAMQTGVMPSLQGTLGATNLTQGVLGGVNFLQSIYRNAFLPRTENITNPYGGGPPITEHQSAQAQENALIASLTGQDVGVINRLRQYSKAQNWATYLYGLGSQFNNQVDAQHFSPSNIAKYFASNGTNLDQIVQQYTGEVGAKGVLPDQTIKGGQIIGINQKNSTIAIRGTNQYGQQETYNIPISQFGKGKDYNALMDTLAGAAHTTHGVGGLSLQTLDEQIRQSGMWKQPQSHSATGRTQQEINKINKLYAGNPQDAIKKLQADVQHQLANAYQGTGQGGPTISIVMKGQAAKMFKANPNKVTLNVNANSGTGPTMNYAIGSPQGSDYLTGYTSYDEGAG